MKKIVKLVLKEVRNILTKMFKRKVPIYIPVYQGNLLKGRCALITGGTSGIGFSIAKSFLENGCTVIITGRNEKKLLRNEEELKKISDDVFSFKLDLSDVNNIEKNIDEIIKAIKYKKIDILVNNAGIISNKNIGETKIEDFENVINTNLRGTYFVSQCIFNYMKKNKIKGNILNIDSSSSLRPIVNPYSLSKWGIKGLTIGMAKKFIDYGIVVNGIAPGPTATNMLIDEEKMNNDISKYQGPITRFIMPEEIANFAVFLTSDMGRMIVGDVLYITGGIGTTTIDDINY